MKHSTLFLLSVALGCASAVAKTPATFSDGVALKSTYKCNSSSAFRSQRQNQIDAANDLMFKGKKARFSKPAKQDPETGMYLPDIVQTAGDALGEMEGPAGKTWHYDMTIEYNHIKHNEYWTEHLPVAFSINIYDEDLQKVGALRDTITLREDEARVRLITMMEKVTRNYFNQDDDYEIVVSVLTNPKNYGINEYTYVYSLGAQPDENGWTKPLLVKDGLISYVLDASTPEKENVLMLYTKEGNSSGYTDSDLSDREKYWEYQTKNFINVKIFGPADENGELPKLFDETKIYLQLQGNQQDDPTVLAMIHDGKATLVYPYYKKIYYKPYYSYLDDLMPEDDNSLMIDIYQQTEAGMPFEKVQTTEIPVVHADVPDVLWSYYGIGAFDWDGDVAWDGDKANFIVTRRDYVASSDSERKSYFVYNADGSLRKMLFENAQSFAKMSEIPGFDPQTLFIGHDGIDYIFNFMNMRTFDIELKLNYGLRVNEDDDPDYIMANIDRTPTSDGASYQYVAEMQMPEYDDVTECNFMRVAWISKEGKLDHIDKVNMGNKVAYAKLFLGPAALQPDFFHSDDTQEYMLLIKRYLEGSATEEQLLVGQVTTDENPAGRDLLLLGPCEYGDINLVSAYPTADGNILTVLYAKNNASGEPVRTQALYRLPLDEVDSPESGVESIPGSAFEAVGPAKYYDLQGRSVNISAAPAGIYVRMQDGKSTKILKK